MKAQVLTGIRQMEMREVAKPAIVNDDDVLLKIEVVGVCGSDVHYYETGKIGSQVVEYPYIVGHECTATVEATGSGVTKLKASDEVAIDPAVSCMECSQCEAGRENTCEKLLFLGTPGQGDGCLCEYIVMPERSCYPTGGKITLDQGVLCEPFSIGIYAVKQSAIEAGAKAAILGAGPIGLSCLAAAKSAGVKKIYMTDKIPQRVRIAKEAGACWSANPLDENIVEAIGAREPSGVNVVYECAGEQETLDEAVEILTPGGVLMLIGIPRADRVSFAIDKIRRKEITIINVRRQNGCTREAIDLIAQKKVDLDFMMTHNFDFADSKEAFDMVAEYRDGVVKAMIQI